LEFCKTVFLIVNMSKKVESVKVAVRCRPLSDNEQRDGRMVIIQVNNAKGEITIKNPKAEAGETHKTFTYDFAYGSDSEQEKIYSDTAYPIVSCVLEGYNGTIFAYGQTGTGKTFSMEGRDEPPELRGIIPRSFEQIFYGVEQHSQSQFLIRASFLEIYNEEIHDLLAKNQKHKLELKENPDSGFYVKDLTSFVVKGIDEMKQMMRAGQKNRHVGETQMNRDSSRSHSIFMIIVERCETGADGMNHITMGKLNLVDLAGSERQSKTGASGDRLKEATNINKSLLTLGNVISALVDGGNAHVPYRDSKLTKLLADSLGGNTKTVMIANIGPADWNYDETISTLRYANRAKNIKNRPTINEDIKDAMIRQFQEEINLLRQQLAMQSGGELVLAPDGRPMIGAPNVVEIVKPIYVEDFGKIKQLEEKLEKEKIEMKQQVEHEIKKVLRQKNLAEDEKHRLVEELKKQEKEKRKAKTNQQRLLKKLKEMEEKLCMGSQMMEQAVRQEQELQKARQEVDAQRRQERELERKLKEKEEVFNMLEQRYSSQQEEVEEKNKKLTKLWKKYQECSNEIRDLHTEFQKEREAMVDTIRVLTEAIKLKTLIVDNFVPKEESTRIERRAVWNEELEEWELPSLDPSKPTSKGKRPGSAVGLARPTSEYARIAWGLGDGNTRFRHTDIITLDLDLPERTTEEYDGNIPIVIQDLIQKILNEIDDDSIYMPIESSSAQPPMRPKTGKRPSTASRKGKRPESGAKRSKPQ
jgi:hypothetical protein